MISVLYINIKKWLQIYGYEVLDYFIVPDHPEETDPRKRYDNFDEQFNTHVGTSEHFQLNQGVDFPFLAIDIHCDSDDRCFSRVYIDFNVYYSTVSPTTGRVCIENTPEGKLEYRDEVHCALAYMMEHVLQTPRGLRKVTFADEVASLENWEKPIRVKVLKFRCPQDFSNELVDEVEAFSIQSDLSVYTCL